jgi:hypothetical protein
MSVDIVNQITLDCLLNKEMHNKHFRSKKIEEKNKEEIKFYRKRTFYLFKEIISGNTPEDLLLDVKYAYDNFINSTVNYFKTIDKNDIIQAEYNDIDNLLLNSNNNIIDLSFNLTDNIEADNLLLRSVKINLHTLDKYVIRTKINKIKDNIILPKQREINLKSYDLKTKGLKKNNITNIYEDKN